MKKLLLFILLSSSSLYAQDKKFTAGILSGAGYSFNYGGWVKLNKIGVEYVRGTANPSLVASPTEYRNIGFNYYFSKLFVGVGVQRVYADDINTLPYANFGVERKFGYNDLLTIRGEVITAGFGYTTLNVGFGINF